MNVRWREVHGFQVKEGGFQVEREWDRVRLRFFRCTEMGVQGIKPHTDFLKKWILMNR